MLTIKDMENIKFRKANLGGYKAEDVDNFISNIKTSFGKLQSENIELLSKIKVLAQKVSEYKDEEESVKIALVKAQKLADTSIKEAKHIADEIILKAKNEADKILVDSKKEIVYQQEMLSGLKKSVKEFRSNILSMYKDHLKLVNDLTADDRVSEKMLEKMEKKPEERVEEKSEEKKEQEDIKKQEPIVEHKSKFTDLKFGENYDVSTDTNESPVGLFNKVH
ncbi:MAG: hypothetical protein RUMPE_00858 [Eubacteriales bacterium SKADARSKE-1]|nr:hypothetical protein [Eubacteriales bacterium SKADARSKE-1]